MSLLPLNQNKEKQVWYGTSSNREETELLVGVPGKARYIEFEVAEVIFDLFIYTSWKEVNEHPKANPRRAPEKRFQRHRNYYIYWLNQFRHWWKTSRLLLRTSGGYEFCLDPINWELMGTYLVRKRRQAAKALKRVKKIGRGGPVRDFLVNVKPFTRTIRVVLAVARGWEARVDNRLYEVSIAEAMAFMGNRCSRWIARTAAHESTRLIAFPISARFIEPYLDQHSRPVIVTMGFIRAVLPFMFSFIGSAIGRQLTFNTYKYANFRWKPVQNVMNFNQDAGVYQDTILDGELQALAHEVAVAIGQGKDPVETRSKMAALGFQMVGSGHGGYAVYRRRELDMAKAFFVHITPYGPSILDEIPRYIVLERKKIFHTGKVGWEEADANILDAAIPPLASIYGFTYSGAFFKSQEWAALTDRFESTLMEYKKACSRLGNQIYTPPTDLQTLKNFIRSGHEPKKKRKDKKRWKEINQEVQVLSKLVAKCQQAGKAPKRVILYLEGLDCSAKSSTGGLICQALQDCGYAVRLAQHNRPPTPEQRAKSWMDRGRFEYPEDVYECDEDIPEYTALIWDRGPAGDFVYGKFAELDMEAKMEKYAEFREYDEICKEEGVLFCKLLFVADKDSIASTLGKRLAHKKIVKDLHTWLDANSVEQAREGLEEIEMHIDPTDFIAFNNYKTNLSIFTSFARNTNKVGYQNPWTVVNTCKRHPTRLMLLKTFEKQLKNFAKEPPGSETTTYRLADLLKQKSIHDGVIRPVPANYVEERQQGLSLRAIFQSMLLVALLYFYAYITWKFDIQEYA